MEKIHLPENANLLNLKDARIKELEADNQKLQEINSALLDNTLEAMLIINRQGNYINANFAAKSLLGLSEENLYSLSIIDSNNSNSNFNNTLPEINPNKTLRLLISPNNVQEVSYITKTTIGKDLLLYVLHDPMAMLSLSINPDKTSLNSQEATNDYPDVLFDSSDDLPTVLSTIGKWVYNLSEKTLVWSIETYNIFGINEEGFELNTNSFLALIHPEDRERVKKTWQETIIQHRHYKQEYRIITPSRKIKWIKEKAKFIFDQSARPLQIEGYYQDITEIKAKEEQLNQQAALLDVVQSAIIVCDSEGIVNFWNKFATQLYGWEKSEALGQHLANLVNNFDKSQWQDCYNNTLSKGSIDEDLEQQEKNGQPLLINSRWNLMDPSNDNKLVLIVNTDVTEKKKLEAQFLRAQRMESIGALAGGIAHDLNNMLSPILMSMHILKKKNTDPINQRMLSTLEATVQRGAGLVKQILSFSRGFETTHIIVDVKQIVIEIEKLVKEIFPRSIEFTFEIEKDLWPIFGDPTQIHQILLNLCVNARDAMSKGGKLKLSVTNINIDKHYAQMRSGCAPGRYILISTSDNGEGIASEHLEKIFEPFFTTKEPGKGTGLGLSTVMSIVKSYHGFINVFSEINKGTVFNIYIPVTENNSSLYQPILETGYSLGRGELILVIDDETAIREITKSALEVHNYNVITACDGIEGLTTYVQYKDDIGLVITDIMMPHMDGIAIVRALQKINPEVKVISITGLSSFSREMELSALGVKKILTKPYSADTLLTTISEILSGSI